MARVMNITRRMALTGIGIFVAMPIHAQQRNSTSRVSSDILEFALLEKSAVFEVVASSGHLKETRQSGQRLIWRLKERPSEQVFQITNLSVGLLRSETGSQVITTFSTESSSLGYATPDEVKVHIIFRTKGGVALHTSVVGISIKCTDKDQSVHPSTDEIPGNIASNVFANVASVEIAEHPEARLPGLKVLRCQ